MGIENEVNYGPQLVPETGTIGDLQLVKRYVLVTGEGRLFYPQQGRYTFETEDRAKTVCQEFIDSNPANSVNHIYVKGLHVEPWWCYPGHFDPMSRVPQTIQDTQPVDPSNYLSRAKLINEYLADPSDAGWEKFCQKLLEMGLPFTYEDAHNTSNTFRGVVHLAGALGIGFEGLGLKEMETGYNQVVLCEFYDSKPQVCIWGDINHPDPIIVKLEGAVETDRKED